jgi:hypothetical protein
MIWFQINAGKFFWYGQLPMGQRMALVNGGVWTENVEQGAPAARYYLFTLLNLTVFTFYGMLAVAISPNVQVRGSGRLSFLLFSAASWT